MTAQKKGFRESNIMLSEDQHTSHYEAETEVDENDLDESLPSLLDSFDEDDEEDEDDEDLGEGDLSEEPQWTGPNPGRHIIGDSSDEDETDDEDELDTTE